MVVPKSITMVYLVQKKINGHVYLYFVESARVNGKAKWIWQEYLGPEKHIKATASKAGGANFTVTTYDFGLPVALMRVAEKLDLIGIIDRYTGKRDQGFSVGQYVAIATLNRCIKPFSKSRVHGWFETTYLQDFIPPVATYLDAMAYANHFEYLTEAAIEQVQAALNEKLRSEYGVAMGELVYDPINFYTYINPGGDDALPQHGHPKDGRRTLRLVGLALLCTQDGGIPLLYDVYSGNVQDAVLFKTELPKVIARAGDLGQQAKEVVLSFDKGNNSPDAFSQIDAAGLTFVASVRPSMAKDLAVVPAS